MRDSQYSLCIVLLYYSEEFLAPAPVDVGFNPEPRKYRVQFIIAVVIVSQNHLADPLISPTHSLVHTESWAIDLSWVLLAFASFAFTCFGYDGGFC